MNPWFCNMVRISGPSKNVNYNAVGVVLSMWKDVVCSGSCKCCSSSRLTAPCSRGGFLPPQRRWAIQKSKFVTLGHWVLPAAPKCTRTRVTPAQSWALCYDATTVLIWPMSWLLLSWRQKLKRLWESFWWLKWNYFQIGPWETNVTCTVQARSLVGLKKLVTG